MHPRLAAVHTRRALRHDRTATTTTALVGLAVTPVCARRLATNWCTVFPVTVAWAARRAKASEQSVGNRQRRSLETGRAGLVTGESGPSPREAQLARERVRDAARRHGLAHPAWTLDDSLVRPETPRSMQYYDLFSWVYEYGTEKLHGLHRLEAVELLRLQPGATVLDVATGTGANLPLLIERIGSSGRICAIDYSPGMLARARSKVENAGWGNVDLIEADARTLDSALVGLRQVDAAICMLGLSVVPDWPDVFQRMLELVRPGGRVVVMDLYLDGKRSSGVANAYYHLLAKADSRRRFWEPLDQQVDDLEIIDHTWFGGVARIAGGTKRPEISVARHTTAGGEPSSTW